MITSSRSTMLVLAISSAGLAACVKPYVPAEDDGPDCVDALDGCQATSQDEAGDVEGTDSTGGPDPLEPGECVANYDPDVLGYRHQCEGSVDFSIEFDIPLIPGPENCIDMQDKIPDHQLCTESHAFGAEPYEYANVASCCGPWDDDPAHRQTYEVFCEGDLADQLCRTLVARLEHHLEWNHFPGFEVQAQSIIDYVASHIDECTTQFLENDVDPSPTQLDSHYDLYNDPNAWPAFVNFTIDVEIGEITGFALPAEVDDWIECQGFQGNDADVFPKPEGLVSGTLDATVLASPTTASLAGPELFGAPVSGDAEFQSIASGCADPRCSAATFVIDDKTREGAITTLDLYAASDVTLHNAIGSYALADVRLELDDFAAGHVDERNTLVIDAGEAWFWIIGRAADDPTSFQRFLTANSTDLVASRRTGSDAWYLEPFEIEYVHFDGDVWTIRIPATTWQ